MAAPIPTCPDLSDKVAVVTGGSRCIDAAKAGVMMLSKQVASEAGEREVRVNCISPSAVLTERTRRFIPEDPRREIAAAHPPGRLGVPEDVGRVML